MTQSFSRRSSGERGCHCSMTCWLLLFAITVLNSDANEIGWPYEATLTQEGYDAKADAWPQHQKAAYGNAAPEPHQTYSGQQKYAVHDAPAPTPALARSEADPSIKKRGIATYASGWGDKYDYFRQMGNLNWYYDWYESQPSDRIRNWANQNGVEFAAQYSRPDQVNRQPDGYSKAILGFNEPNIRSQSSTMPKDAVDPWKKVMSTAQQRKLPLGSPSASQCAWFEKEKDCITRSAFPWFDQWLGNCTAKGVDCKFDFTTLHFYGCNAEYLVAYVTEFYKKFKKPIWITEMGCCLKDIGLNSTEEERQQLLYARRAFKALDKLDFVARYAWFEVNVDGWDCLGSSNNLFKNNKLTNLGKVFTNTPITGQDLAQLNPRVASALTAPVPDVYLSGSWWDLCGDCDDSSTFKAKLKSLKFKSPEWNAFVRKCRDCGFNDMWKPSDNLIDHYPF